MNSQQLQDPTYLRSLKIWKASDALASDQIIQNILGTSGYGLYTPDKILDFVCYSIYQKIVYQSLDFFTVEVSEDIILDVAQSSRSAFKSDISLVSKKFKSFGSILFVVSSLSNVSNLKKCLAGTQYFKDVLDIGRAAIKKRIPTVVWHNTRSQENALDLASYASGCLVLVNLDTINKKALANFNICSQIVNNAFEKHFTKFASQIRNLRRASQKIDLGFKTSGEAIHVLLEGLERDLQSMSSALASEVEEHSESKDPLDLYIQWMKMIDKTFIFSEQFSSISKKLQKHLVLSLALRDLNDQAWHDLDEMMQLAFLRRRLTLLEKIIVFVKTSTWRLYYAK